MGHATRSAAQCEAAADDITVLTSILEARLLEGDPRAPERLAEAIDPARVWLGLGMRF